MSRVVYPGSFDPITLGHVDVIRRAASMFDNVIVLVAEAASKTSLFTVEERLKLTRESLKSIKNVTVESHKGLTVDFARKSKCNLLLRSVRNVADFDYERTISEANLLLNADIETLFLAASPKFTGIASSVVKEIAKNHGNLESFVPSVVAAALKKKFK